MSDKISLRCSDCKKQRICRSSRKGPHTRCFEPIAATNAGRIRAMTDEELAEFLIWTADLHGPDFCQQKTECNEMLEKDIDIPQESCRRCLLKWLRGPADRSFY